VEESAQNTKREGSIPNEHPEEEDSPQDRNEDECA